MPILGRITLCDVDITQQILSFQPHLSIPFTSVRQSGVQVNQNITKSTADPGIRYFNLIEEGCDDDMLKRDKVVGGGAKGDTSTLAPTCGQAGLTYHNS